MKNYVAPNLGIPAPSIQYFRTTAPWLISVADRLAALICTEILYGI